MSTLPMIPGFRRVRVDHAPQHGPVEPLSHFRVAAGVLAEQEGGMAVGLPSASSPPPVGMIGTHTLVQRPDTSFFS